MVKVSTIAAPLLMAVIASPAHADIFDSPTPKPHPIHSQFGGIGLLKTRTARVAPDSTLSTSISWNDQQQRYGVTFQAAPWLETTFGYTGFETSFGNETFDRQFDIKIKLWDEGLYLPQVAVGFQDFLGTGLFAGEYVVASKRVGPLDLSFGVGWGRLGSREDISNPLADISPRFESRGGFSGQGGEVNFDFFQGEDVGFFGGVSYQTPLEGLQLIAEYDSDNNEIVQDRNDNPLNLGFVYNVSPGIQLTGSYLGLEDINLQATFSAVVGETVRDEPVGTPPPLFFVRENLPAPEGGRDGLIAPVAPPVFTPIPTDNPKFAETLKTELKRIGIDLLSLEAGSEAIRIRVANNRYRSTAKAVGRAARILSRFAPANIETFQVVIVVRSLEIAELKLGRSLLEASAREIGHSVAPPSLGFAYIVPGSAPVDAEIQNFDTFPKYDWSIGPDVRYSAFDPDDPLRGELRAEAKGSIEFAPGLSVEGSVGREIIGNLDDADRESDSVLPRVRSEANRYNAETDVGVFRLAGEYLFNPAPNVYAKVSGGLLEQMFAGFGGEVLYRPPNSRLAFGGELYYARQRDFDTLFSFQDYDVITGHASIYYDTPYAHWNVALHAGRYLAADLGATLEVSRRFPNGWEVGAFATITDVPFEEFGEGSFDKGITLSIPLDWGLPRDTKSKGALRLRPLQRDGGQRLNPGSRLFGLTREGSHGEIAPQWDSFAH